MDSRIPIILIGMNRSGTKWLSNMLSNHSDIISLQNERGGGIIETNMFDNFPKAFGDLFFPDNYIGLIECWSETDFFKYAGAYKERFYQLSPKPSCYFELFKILMEDVATRHKKKYWLQKTNPFNGLSCMKHYRNAKFIVIKRNILDNLKSNIQMHMNRGGKLKKIAKEVFFYIYQEKLLTKILKQNNVIFIKYENLKDDLEKHLKAVCTGIGIDFQQAMLKVKYKPNTSFKNKWQRQALLSKTDKFRIRAYSFLFNSLPLVAFYVTHKLLSDRRPRFIPGTFGSIKDSF